MKAIKTGKPFENLVATIKKATMNLENVQVLIDHKIIDDDGIKRQFDVFIIIKISDYDINIAVECKEYVRKVSVDKVDAFIGKCSSIKQINKKIMVSPYGFQKGAVNKANNHFIELYTLGEVSVNTVNKWIDLDTAGLLIGDFKLFDCRLEFYIDDLREMISEYENSDIIIFRDGFQTTLIEAIIRIYKRKSKYIKRDLITEVYKNDNLKNAEQVKMYRTYFAEYNDGDVWIEKNEEKYYIKRVLFIIEYDSTFYKADKVENREYAKTNNIPNIDALSFQFKSNELNINLIKYKDQNDIKAYLIAKDRKIVELDENNSIDPDSDN